MDFTEFKERVRAASDITDVVGRYVDLKPSGSNFKGLCPFHNEKTPSFHVMPDNQFFYCFGCHKGGDVFTFLCDYNNMDFNEALEELAGYAGLEMPEKFDASSGGELKKGLKTKLLEMYKEAAEVYYGELFSERGKRAFEYLADRGISRNMMTAFGLGYAPDEGDHLYRHLKEKGFSDDELKESGLFSYKSGSPKDFFRDRVMYPIMNRASRVIAFGGRVIGDGLPKYINSPETLIYSKKDNLFGLQRAIRAKNGRIMLVEGYMDVIAAQQAGYTEAVASLGTALTKEQATLISKMADKVYLIYDADGAGKKAMLKAIPILKGAGLFVNVVSMQPFKDPDELIKAEGREGFEKRLASAENAFFFETEELSKDYNLDDPSERAGFEEEVAKRIADFPNKFERELFINTLSERYNIDKALLKSEVSEIGLKGEREGGAVYRVKDIRSRAYRPQEGKETNADEKNVLCSILSSPEYFEDISAFVSPEDFSDGIIRDAAAIAFEGMKSGGITVAQIIGRFSDTDASAISSIFSDNMYSISDEEEKKKFISDSVLSMLKKKVNAKLAACSEQDAQKYAELNKRKKELEGIETIFEGGY